MWIKHLLKPVKQLTCEEIITCICFLIDYVEYLYWHRNQYFLKIICLNVYLQTTSMYSKNCQNTVMDVWGRRKRFICTLLVGPMTRITTLLSKLGEIAFRYYEEMPSMVFTCIDHLGLVLGSQLGQKFCLHAKFTRFYSFILCVHSFVSFHFFLCRIKKIMKSLNFILSF